LEKEEGRSKHQGKRAKMSLKILNQTHGFYSGAHKLRNLKIRWNEINPLFVLKLKLVLLLGLTSEKRKPPTLQHIFTRTSL